MAGAMSDAGRVSEVDRRYIPVKTRKGKKSLQREQLRRDETDDSKAGKGGGANMTEILSTENPNLVDKCLISLTNLDRFMDATTPSVLAQYFSKTTMRGWNTCDVDYQYYFTLDALWESFKEWSAYGAGVPLVLGGRYPDVVQYYVPYLSAIQLYGECTVPGTDSRQVGDNSDGDDSKVFGSDESSDYEVEEHLYSAKSFSSPGKDNPSQEGFSSDDSKAGNTRGHLLFEYLEPENPYSREPLAEKIEMLSCLFPGLKTLRSCDLLPRSWFSVAWYPIYRIPTVPTLKDLDACFLTFHHLSVPSKGTRGSKSLTLVFLSGMNEVPRFAFNAFGLAVYKFRGSTWTRNGVGGESSQVKSLVRAADKWIKLVGVTHPDFDFFVSRG